MRRGKLALILGIAGGVVAVGATTMVIIGCTTHSIYCYQIPNADCMKGIILNTDRVQCAWYPCATGISPCYAPDDSHCYMSIFGCSCFSCSWYETPDKQEFKKESYELVPIHENDYTYRLYAQMDQSIGEYRLAIEINFACVVSWAEVKTNVSGGGTTYSSTWRMEEADGDLAGAYSPGTYYGRFDTTLTSSDQASSAKVQVTGTKLVRKVIVQ